MAKNEWNLQADGGSLNISLLEGESIVSIWEDDYGYLMVMTNLNRKYRSTNTNMRHFDLVEI